FEAVLLDLGAGEGELLLPVWRRLQQEGYLFFAELRVSATMTDGVPRPLAFVARYHARLEPKDTAGFVPVGYGVLGGPYRSLGVGSNLVDVAGNTSELTPVGFWGGLEDHDDALELASLVYGEASTKDVYEEMSAIAQVCVRQMKARGFKKFKVFMDT